MPASEHLDGWFVVLHKGHLVRPHTSWCLDVYSPLFSPSPPPPPSVVALSKAVVNSYYTRQRSQYEDSPGSYQKPCAQSTSYSVTRGLRHLLPVVTCASAFSTIGVAYFAQTISEWRGSSTEERPTLVGNPLAFYKLFNLH